MSAPEDRCAWASCRDPLEVYYSAGLPCRVALCDRHLSIALLAGGPDERQRMIREKCRAVIAAWARTQEVTP